MPNEPVDPNQDFGANIGTILVCAAALVMIYTAVQSPTAVAIGIASVLGICAVALLAWRYKAFKEHR